MDPPSLASAGRALESSVTGDGGNGGHVVAADAAGRDVSGGSSLSLLPLLLDNRQASGPMVEALESLRRALLCPICDSVFQSPMTSSCGHSFCKICIDRYMADHETCPVEGCHMPLSMSSKGKSSRQHNPQLDEVAESYRNIVSALLSSPPPSSFTRRVRRSSSACPHPMKNDEVGWWETPIVEDAIAMDPIGIDDDGADYEDDDMAQQDEDEIDLSTVPLCIGRPSYGSSSSGNYDDNDNNEDDPSTRTLT